MKTLLCWCAMFGLLLAGCGQKEKEQLPKQATNAPANPASAPTAAAGGNPITAPVDYLAAVGKAKIASEKTIDTVGLNQAIQLFNVQEGRYPKNLKELVEKEFIRVLPEPPYGMQIVYDSNTGTVKILRK
jgi:hypothetical protein